MFSLRSIHNFFASAFTFYLGGGIGEAALLGAAVGGGTSLVTGQDPLKGALLGGLTGGAGNAMFGGAAAIPALDTAGVDAGGLTTANAGIMGNLGSVYNPTTELPNILSASGQSMVNPALIGPNMGQTASTIGQSLGNQAGSVADTLDASIAPAGNISAQGAQGGIRDALNLKPGSMASKGLDWWDKQDTLTQAGLGGAGILGARALTQKPNTVAPLPKYESKLAGYDRNTFTPTDSIQPNPYYTAQYAQGGIAAMAGPQGSMYPQSQQDQTQYATPSQMPTSSSVINAGYEAQTDPYTGEPTKGFAAGGGIGSLGGYAHGGNPQLLDGPGDGMSDSIPASIGNKQPARLAQGEFVVPADVVSHLGNGSTDAGAKHLYTMMNNVRKARTGNPKQGKQINPAKYLA